MTPNAAARPRTIADRAAFLNPCAAAVACLLAAPVAAFPGGVYTVAGVAVDETAATAALAREAAIADAHVSAFGRLVRRLVPKDRQAEVPRLPAGRVAPLVRGFGIDGEKTSDVRYIADMTFRFRRDGVRRFLQERGIRFAETASRPVLVLPVHDDAGALRLWERPAPWLDAWKRLPPSDGLVPMILPEGSLADVRDLGAERAFAGDLRRIRPVAERHGAAWTAVAALRLRADLGARRRTVEVAFRRFGEDQPREPLTVRLDRGGGSDAAFDAAARAAAEALEEDWKRRNLLRFGRPGRIVARLPLQRLADWVAVRERLRSVAPLRELRLIAVSRREAAVRMEFYGTVEQLRLALVQRDLDLDARAGSWRLGRRDGARR